MTLSDATKRNRAWSLILSSTICSLMLIFAGAVAQAKVLDLCVDPSDVPKCSATIQAAVLLVPAKHSAVITIAAGTYAEDVTVSNITVSFVGAGAGKTIVDGTNSSEKPTFLFQNKSVGELHAMTIRNGDGTQGSNVQFIQYASAKSNTGAGTLKIENCEITGGVHPSDVGGLGAVAFAGKTLTIDSSSISNNSEEGLILLNASLSHAYITNTTITGNETPANQGDPTGCGIHTSTATVVLNNDTITDNQCSGGTGAGHSPTVGGGLYVDFPGSVSIANTIIAKNTVSGTNPAGPDCYAPGTKVKSKGYNLIKNPSACNIKLTKTDLLPGTDPGLSAPAECLSSSLLVLAPKGGSPIIAKGNPGKPAGKIGVSSASCLPTDECGTARAKGTCSIGAIE
jgi:hypothetical protein